jgi:hypothetical protein
MAVLTAADYNQIRSALYREGQGKEELKAHAALPNEVALKAGFQALEDRWEATRASYKTNFDAAAGLTTTANEMGHIFEAWFANRRARGL